MSCCRVSCRLAAAVITTHLLQCALALNVPYFGDSYLRADFISDGGSALVSLTLHSTAASLLPYHLASSNIVLTPAATAVF